jgi:hypothetical protein
MPINGKIGPIYLPLVSAASVYFSRNILHGRLAYRRVPLSIRCAGSRIDGIFGCPQAEDIGDERLDHRLVSVYSVISRLVQFEPVPNVHGSSLACEASHEARNPVASSWLKQEQRFHPADHQRSIAELCGGANDSSAGLYNRLPRKLVPLIGTASTQRPAQAERWFNSCCSKRYARIWVVTSLACQRGLPWAHGT